jgi:hypothetical protein
VFEAARGASDRESDQESLSAETDVASFAAMIREIADRPELMALVKDAVALSPRESELILRAIRLLNQRTDGQRRDKRG